MKLNPIFKKDIKVQSRGYDLLGLLCVVDSLLFFVGIFGMLAITSRLRQSMEADYGALLKIYGVIAILSFAALTAVGPAMTSGSISGERQTKTLELLLTTRISLKSIVIGKLEAAFYSLTILVISSIPALMLPLLYGGLGLLDVGMTIFAFLASALMYLSIGMYAGAGRKTVQKSTVAAYGILLIFLAGTALPGMLSAPFCTENRDNMMALLLMANPFMTMLELISEQTGWGFAETLHASLNCRYFEILSGAYVWISLTIQLAISAAFTAVAIRKGRQL